ncbi:MAG: alpha-ketoacid dehydrogenase subunit beta [Chloroflexota bacterium]|nr:alpha-ketoacid dehydrogenase subunit beta [Dehalococcoidia bacterium]MDW8254725.1 alpha-ketoacid dehydrogenase subunit beta [Chloroflexota bacterium]
MVTTSERQAPAPASAGDERLLTYAQALNEALREEMRRDPTVFVMGEDVAAWGGGGVFGVTRGLADEFGTERVRDTPISEEAIVALAVGAAAAGSRPVVELMYVDFVGLAMEPLVNQAAKLRYMFGGKVSVPLVLRTQQGAGRGNAAQHSQSLEAWFCHVPGLKVVTPSTPADAKGLLVSAIRDNNPVVFLEHKLLYGTRGYVPAGEYAIPLGVADIKRPGRHVTVVGIHMMVLKALQAAEQLAEEGIELEVIDPRTLVPLDEAAIVASVKKTGRLIVTHEAVTRAGYGAEIVARVVELAFDYLDAPPLRVCGKNVPVPYSAVLEEAALPQVADLVAAARALVRGAA